MQRGSTYLLAACIAAFGCSGTRTPPGLDGEDGGPGDGSGIGQGEDCSGGEECAEGLICAGTNGTCQPEGAPGTAAEGDDCKVNFECTYGLVCASDGKCAAAGAAGTVAKGGSCEESADCQMFLTCLDKTCQGYQPAFWTGETCAASAPEDEPLKVYFDVAGDSVDFYRLPFPNDIRKKDGRIDLTGHPNPGILIEELGNPVDDYFSVIENDLDGFGTMSYVFFRMNKWPDGSTLKSTDSEGYQRNLYIVDIDADSPTYGEKVWSGFRGDTKRGLYICGNWFAIGPSLGHPLASGTTYAAIITTNVKDKDGNDIEQDDDFKTMLKSEEPSESGMKSAWNAYAPFRSYLDDKNIESSKIAAAAVFTTGTPEAKIPKLRAAVRKEAQPEVSDTDVDKKSYSDDGFVLYTGKVTVPLYQRGERPFREMEADGVERGYNGSIEYVKGSPKKVGEEGVRFALTVPTATDTDTGADTDTTDTDTEESGWPVVLFAHGTGGDEMSFVNSGVAKLMADIGVAVIGVEQVMHGERRGVTGPEADLEANSPERLFYNFLNPRAARDNNVQAAADYFQLVRLVENFETVFGGVKFDTEKIYFFGHSQGSQGPLLFAAHEPLVKGVIMSGAGGYMIESFLGKKKPIDISTMIKLAIADVDVDEFHPLLNLIQAAFDDVDPANYGGTLFRPDWGIDPARNVFMSYGVGDTYTPEKTQIALAKSMKLFGQLPVGDHKMDGLTVLTDSDLPYSRSVATGVMVQYEPDGDYDGHFVIFENKDALDQYPEFVRTMVANGAGTLIKVPSK